MSSFAKTLKPVSGGLNALRALHEQRILMTCPICGADATEMDQAIVLYKLLNGPEGTKLGNVCQSHKVGEPWHGVGEVTSITREGVKLTREPGRLFYSHAEVTPTVEVLPIANTTEEPTTTEEVEEVDPKTHWDTTIYAKVHGISVSTAGKRLLKLFKAGQATREKVGRGYIYTLVG